MIISKGSSIPLFLQLPLFLRLLPLPPSLPRPHPPLSFSSSSASSSTCSSSILVVLLLFLLLIQLFSPRRFSLFPPPLFFLLLLFLFSLFPTTPKPPYHSTFFGSLCAPDPFLYTLLRKTLSLWEAKKVRIFKL